MRKAVFGLCLLLVLSMLTFGQAKTTISVWLLGWTNEMVQIAQNLADSEFTPKTGITVSLEPLAYADSGNKVMFAMASRDTPDILSLGGIVADLALRGGLIDLAAFRPEEYAELEQQLFTSVMGPFTIEARRFALPSDVSCLVGAYRVDILSEMGMEIPKTWKEIIAAQPKALAQGRTFAFMNFDELWAAYSMITQYGGQFFAPDGFASALDTPESIEGFINYVELFTKHGFPKEVPSITPFITGENISHVEGLWLYSKLTTAAPHLEGKWKIGLVPGVERDGKLYNGSSPGSVLLAISAFSKHKAEAWEFLKWFLGTDVLIQIANGIIEKGSGHTWLPSSKHAMERVNLPEEVKRVYIEQIEASVPVPYGINSMVQYRYIVFAIQKAVVQNADPREAILEAARDMNADMARRKVEYQRFLAEFDKNNAR